MSAYPRHKAIEKIIGPTDLAWVQAHENYIPGEAQAPKMDHVKAPQGADRPAKRNRSTVIVSTAIY